MGMAIKMVIPLDWLREIVMSNGWSKFWFRADGGFRCLQCGKARNTLQSIIRHILQKHTMKIETRRIG